MKTEIIVLVGIALCTMLLISPAIASSVDTLEIYGNANEDDTIDMRDLTYVKLIFFGKKPVTELADAKYDGKINPLDFIQIKLIIVGKEKELTIVDDFPKIVTIHKPVKRIVILSTYGVEAIRSLKAVDKVVGVPGYLAEQHGAFFPELSKLPGIGSGFTPDIEKVLELEPDVVIAYEKSPDPGKFDAKLPENIKVVHLSFSRAELMIKDFEKLGYILNKRDEAKELTDFYEEFTNTINEQVEELLENEKPRIYIESIWSSESEYRAAGKGTGADDACTIAGGINIADHTGTKTVDPEWVITQNPDIIVGMTFTAAGCGYEHDDPSKMKAIREGIMNRPELAEVTAVKEGKVYCVAFQIVGKPRYFVSIAYLTKWFHPELFEDIDPKAIHQEYLERFQGMPYRGMYAYPEPS